MSHGLRAAISSSGSVSGGVAFQREEKTPLRLELPLANTMCRLYTGSR